jgi:hypothetical protein
MVIASPTTNTLVGYVHGTDILKIAIQSESFCMHYVVHYSPNLPSLSKCSHKDNGRILISADYFLNVQLE